ncbi:MAG: ORF6N domain-containing protein [Terriglobales bacterium]
MATREVRNTSRKSDKGAIIPIQSRIVILRRNKVILDTALAELYGVSVKRLNQQVKRNGERFPADFMFQTTTAEVKCLRLQFATSKVGRGGRRSNPYAFTEHGAIMVASVLNSERAVRMSVFVVRAFVHLRELLAGNRQLASKIEELEGHLHSHDEALSQIVAEIRRLAVVKASPRRRIGFQLSARRTAS